MRCFADGHVVMTSKDWSTASAAPYLSVLLADGRRGLLASEVVKGWTKLHEIYRQRPREDVQEAADA